MDGPVIGLFAGGLPGASCQKKGEGGGGMSCTDASPQLDLSISVPNYFVIDCVC